MRSSAFSPLLAAAFGAGRALAALSFSATASQNGAPVDDAHIAFERIAPLSHLSRHHHSSSHATDPLLPKRDTAITLTGDWCGAVNHPAPGDEITSVFAYFTAPDLTLRSGAGAPQFAAAWVGIDGASCQSALLQAGITTVVNSNGEQSASAWWEWVPDSSYSITNFPVQAGDWISVNISASDSTTASIVISNLNQDYTTVLTLTNGPALCRVDADWILEDFFSGSEQVPFGAFQDLWFENCVATTASGSQFGIDGGALLYLGDSTADAKCAAVEYDDGDFYCTSENN